MNALPITTPRPLTIQLIVFIYLLVDTKYYENIKQKLKENVDIPLVFLEAKVIYKNIPN